MDDRLIYAVTSLDEEQAKNPDIVVVCGKKEDILLKYHEEKQRKERENCHVTILASSIE